MEFGVFQWFPARCKELGIEIEEYTYFIDCDKYEFKDSKDLEVMCRELLDYSFKSGEDFQWRVKNFDDTHLILLYDPEEYE